MTETLAKTSTDATAVSNTKFVSVLEILDRLMAKGVVVDGQLMLTVADIDLIQLNLKLLLAGVATLEQEGDGDSWRMKEGRDGDPSPTENRWQASKVVVPAEPREYPPASQERFSISEATRDVKGHLPFHEPGRIKGAETARLNMEPEKIERGLAKLVLTVVELLRLLMERQAVRRMEKGNLSPTEVEKLGKAFLKLSERMQDLKEFFGLQDEDLNLKLGPLGDLI